MDPEPGNYSLFPILLDVLSSPSLALGQLLLFMILLMISFLVSGAEVAFFSLSKVEIEAFREDKTKISQRVWRLINQPKRLLATILISNNFVNVSAILVGTSILQSIFDALPYPPAPIELGALVFSIEDLLNLLVITSALLFFGEIVPKVYAAKNRIFLVKALAVPLEALRLPLSPFSWLLIHTTGFIDRRVQLKEEQTSLQDLRDAIELTATDEIAKEDQGILKGIVNFSNIPVKSVMRARVDVIAVEINTPTHELMELINSHGYSRMPVYEESLDNVKGVLHIKDLLPYLREEEVHFNLHELMRSVHFVPESKKIDKLLDELKTQRLHLAVVVDEYGGTAGIVTLEDIIEEIFGEIHDEFDSEDWVYTKIDDMTYIFEGRISLIDVKKIVGLGDEAFEDARGDSDSLGGLILELYGKIPNPGEIISYHNIELQVEAVSKTRITMVKLRIHPPVEENV